MFIILFQQDLEQISLNVPLEIWMDLWNLCAKYHGDRIGKRMFTGFTTGI